MNKAIFKENIKRFWPISLAAFIAYFMCGPFNLLQTNPESTYGVLPSAVSTRNIGYAFVTCAMCIAIGAAVYAYLFKVNSTVFMHASPASRWNLFISSAASGLALGFIPVAMNTLVLLAIRLSGRYDLYFTTGSEFRTAEMWNAGGIAGLMLVIWVEIIFILAICTLSAVISGNAVINVLTSIGLNILTTLVYLSAMGYGSCFLYGFTESSMNEEVVFKLHPVLNYGIGGMVFASDTFVFNGLSLLAYVVAAAVIYAASYWIYTKRPNEKAGDSYVFDVVGIIIGAIMVYMGSSCIGLIFEDGLGLWGFVIGGLFSFFVGQLIIQKSFRIFNRRLLAAFAVSFIVMAIVLAGFALDLFHIERNIPKAENVTSVEINDSSCYGGYSVLADPENIQVVIELHSAIVANKDDFEKRSRQTFEEGNDESWGWLELTYHLKNGKLLKRSYSVPESFIKENASLDKVYSSAEVLGAFDSLRETRPQDAQIEIYINDYSWDKDYYNPFAEKYGKAMKEKYNDYYGLSDLSNEEKTSLMLALSRDQERIGLRNINYSEHPSFFEVDIEIIHPLEEYEKYAYSNNFHDYWYSYDEAGKKNGVKESFNLSVLETYTETLSVIEEILSNHLN